MDQRQDRVAAGHVGVGDAGGDPGFAGRGADRHPSSGLAPAVEGDAGGIHVAALAQVVDAGADGHLGVGPEVDAVEDIRAHPRQVDQENVVPALHARRPHPVVQLLGGVVTDDDRGVR